MFSQIKDRKHIEQNIHFDVWVIPWGWDLGVLGGGGSKTLTWGFAAPPSTAHSSLCFGVYHAVLSVHCSHVVTCWERAGLLALMYVMVFFFCF